MKKIMKITFLVLISVISTKGIASSDQENLIKKPVTVADYLQNVVVMDNKLVAENEKLVKENMALKKNMGWVDVSLDDKQPFDENCEYRAKISFLAQMINLLNLIMRKPYFILLVLVKIFYILSSVV